jgi:hypothetical protein
MDGNLCQKQVFPNLSPFFLFFTQTLQTLMPNTKRYADLASNLTTRGFTLKLAANFFLISKNFIEKTKYTGRILGKEYKKAQKEQ